LGVVVAIASVLGHNEFVQPTPSEEASKGAVEKLLSECRIRERLRKLDPGPLASATDQVVRPQLDGGAQDTSTAATRVTVAMDRTATGRLDSSGRLREGASPSVQLEVLKVAAAAGTHAAEAIGGFLTRSAADGALTRSLNAAALFALLTGKATSENETRLLLEKVLGPHLHAADLWLVVDDLFDMVAAKAGFTIFGSLAGAGATIRRRLRLNCGGSGDPLLEIRILAEAITNGVREVRAAAAQDNLVTTTTISEEKSGWRMHLCGRTEMGRSTCSRS